MTEQQRQELANLFSLARTALEGSEYQDRHARRLWAVREFLKAHPTVKRKQAYRALIEMDAWRRV